MASPEVAGDVEILDEEARQLLEDSLYPGETVQFCLLGRRAKASPPTKEALVALDDRILVLRTGLSPYNTARYGGGISAVSLYYADLNSLDLRKNFGRASINIDRPGLPLPPEIVIDKGRLDEYRPYVDQINRKVHEAKQENKVKPSTGNQLVSELERLAALRTSGALTEEEFQQAKLRLLG